MVRELLEQFLIKPVFEELWKLGMAEVDKRVLHPVSNAIVGIDSALRDMIRDSSD